MVEPTNANPTTTSITAITMLAALMMTPANRESVPLLVALLGLFETDDAEDEADEADEERADEAGDCHAVPPLRLVLVLRGDGLLLVCAYRRHGIRGVCRRSAAAARSRFEGLSISRSPAVPGASRRVVCRRVRECSVALQGWGCCLSLFFSFNQWARRPLCAGVCESGVGQLSEHSGDDGRQDESRQCDGDGDGDADGRVPTLTPMMTRAFSDLQYVSLPVACSMFRGLFQSSGSLGVLLRL